MSKEIISINIKDLTHQLTELCHQNEAIGACTGEGEWSCTYCVYDIENVLNILDKL